MKNYLMLMIAITGSFVLISLLLKSYGIDGSSVLSNSVVGAIDDYLR